MQGETILAFPSQASIVLYCWQLSQQHEWQSLLRLHSNNQYAKFVTIYVICILYILFLVSQVGGQREQWLSSAIFNHLSNSSTFYTLLIVLTPYSQMQNQEPYLVCLLWPLLQFNVMSLLGERVQSCKYKQGLVMNYYFQQSYRVASSESVTEWCCNREMYLLTQKF
jgi:hypothetical protein